MDQQVSNRLRTLSIKLNTSVNQGRLASAAVPTAFAGLHAYATIIASAYFLSEQWKERHRKSWGRLFAIARPVAEKVGDYSSRLRDYGSQIRKQSLLIYTHLTVKTTQPPGPTSRDKKNGTDLELGEIFIGVVKYQS